MRLAMHDAGVPQAVDQAVGERGREILQSLGRQLLRAQFQQQVTRAHQATRCAAVFFSSGKPSASRLSRYASATALAKVRTRRMNRCRSVTETARLASSRLKEWDAFTICS